MLQSKALRNRDVLQDKLKTPLQKGGLGGPKDSGISTAGRRAELHTP